MRLASNFGGVGSRDRDSSRRIYWSKSDGALLRIPQKEYNYDCGAYSERKTPGKAHQPGTGRCSPVEPSGIRVVSFQGTKLLYHLIESHQCLLGAGWLSSATEVLIRTQHELIAYRHRPRRQLGCARALCARPQLIVLPPFGMWLRPSPTDLHSRPGGQSRQ